MRPNVGGVLRSVQPGRFITFFWEGKDCRPSFSCEGRRPVLRTFIGGEISFLWIAEALLFGVTEEIDSGALV
jgi:hypothetical protein